METKEIIEKVLEALTQFRGVIDIFEVIMLGYLGRKVARTSKTVENVASTSNVVVEEKHNAPTSLKRQARANVLNALDLYFSDKPDYELTDDEKQQIDALTLFIGGKK